MLIPGEKMIVNPKQFSWEGASTRVDGSAYAVTDRKGYDLAIKPVDTPDSEFVTVLGIISDSQSYVAPIADLANPITKGTWVAGVREVDVNDIRSDWAQIAFMIEVAPSVPTNFIAS